MLLWSKTRSAKRATATSSKKRTSVQSVWKVKERARYLYLIEIISNADVIFSLKDNSVTSTFVNNSYYRVTVEARFNIKKKDPGSRKVLLVSGHRQDVELDILMATAA